MIQPLELHLSFKHLTTFVYAYSYTHIHMSTYVRVLIFHCKTMVCIHSLVCLTSCFNDTKRQRNKILVLLTTALAEHGTAAAPTDWSCRTIASLTLLMSQQKFSLLLAYVTHTRTLTNTHTHKHTHTHTHILRLSVSLALS